MGNTARIRGLLGAVVAAGVITAGVGVASPASAGGACRYNDPFVYNLHAVKTSCGTARKVAAEWQRKAPYNDGAYVHTRVRAHGFTCVFHDGHTVCKRDAKRVTFDYGF